MMKNYSLIESVYPDYCIKTINSRSDFNSELYFYKGRYYQIPFIDIDSEDITIDDATLSMDYQTVSSRQSFPFFYTERKAQSLVLFIEEGDIRSTVDYCQVVFHLFREGTSKALATIVEDLPMMSPLLLEFPDHLFPMKPGNYFLLAGNAAGRDYLDNEDGVKNRFVFPFTIFATGKKTAKPAIRKSVIRRPLSTMMTGKFTSGTLLMKLDLCGLDGKIPTQISVSCYTEDEELMCKTNPFTFSENTGSKGIVMPLRSSKIWFEGRYTAVVTVNQEPCYRLDFDYSGRGFTSAEVKPLNEKDNLHWMTKYLENTCESKWKQVREFPGISQCKLQLIQLSRLREYNKHCQDLRMNILQGSSFYTISAHTPIAYKQLASLLPDLFGLPQHQLTRLDTKEWLASWDEFSLSQRDKKTLILYEPQILSDPDNAEILDVLNNAIVDTSVSWSLILCGSPEGISRLLEASPQLAKAIPAKNRFEIASSTLGESVHLLQKKLDDYGFRLSPKAENRLCEEMISHKESMHFLSAEEVENCMLQGIIANLKQRLQRKYAKKEQASKEKLVTVLPEDIRLSSRIRPKAEEQTEIVPQKALRFNETIAELNGMVGLQSFKEKLDETFCQIRFNEERKRFGLPTDNDGSYHMIFTGNPGTGKTTVAKMVGKIFRSMGLLSKGEVITMERTQLVGKFIGETENNMKDVLEKAKGNVLFIDEAYTLCDSLDDRKDYGNHVVESLLTFLSEPHSDMIIIMAGYADEMERLLKMNQGLKSRFAYKFHFSDFSADDLLQIAAQEFVRRQYELTPEAQKLLESTVRNKVLAKDRHFGNGRWIKQFILSGVLPAMARRVMEMQGKILDIRQLQTIEVEDIIRAARQYAAPEGPTLIPRRIGFTA